uniref:Uncharacterized protein n=1 Tax=Pipistrellus kuhlii TaxID=59472 RepID=A0A7J7YME5_PIPKU|nr:hypothetical protein mPipKuh1_010072 [Pipistrellus kuhlii]
MAFAFYLPNSSPSLFQLFLQLCSKKRCYVLLPYVSANHCNHHCPKNELQSLSDLKSTSMCFTPESVGQTVWLSPVCPFRCPGKRGSSHSKEFPPIVKAEIWRSKRSDPHPQVYVSFLPAFHPPAFYRPKRTLGSTLCFRERKCSLT